MFTVIPLCWFSFNLIARISTNNMNNKAETGHPCRIPLFKGNLSESQPLFLWWYKDFCTEFLSI